jgi:redox-sensing transcriptional repressor
MKLNYNINDSSVIVPEVVVQRIPHYLNILSILQLEKTKIVSSEQLGYLAQITPAQIRKDLSYFGKFGKQGKGYTVNILVTRLREILGVNIQWEVCLIGVGRLGRALLNYPGFAPEGFNIVAAFDSDPQQIGQQHSEIIIQNIQNISDFLKRSKIKIAIVAVPANVTKDILNLLYDSGIKAVLNYAPFTPLDHKDMIIRNIDPVTSLQSLTYYLK